MTDMSCYFKNHCDGLVKSLKMEDVNNFKNACTDEDRIKYLYHHAKEVPIHMCVSGRDIEAARKNKIIGNEYYGKKELQKAIDEYNIGVVHCPQDTKEGEELVAVLIANRSAVFFEQRRYSEACDDINYVRNLSSYPNQSLHKILLRQAKCYTHLSRNEDALKTFIETQAVIKKTEPMPPDLAKKVVEVEHAISDLKQNLSNSDLVVFAKSRTEDNIAFNSNGMYPSANTCVTFDEDPFHGRFAKAAQDIHPGTLIIQETAHCMVISKENITMNCTRCAKSTDSPYPCRNCAFCIYCSAECMKGASFHSYECEILPTLYLSGASVNCLMALRLLTQKGFSFFWDQREALHSAIPKTKPYTYCDYLRVYNLCTNCSIRPIGEFAHYTFMAIYLLRLLKKTHFFPLPTEDDMLTEKERFIGSLILRHLQILQFNAHEISELRNCEPHSEYDVNYHSAHVGGALHPTLALFNHSCEPSIIRYYRGNKIIARTITFIPKGEVIYENYGPIYSSHIKSERQMELKSRYWFDCRCNPCEEEWPLFANMSLDSFRLPCSRCKNVNIINKNITEPMYNCATCTQRNGLFSVLMNLMPLEELTQKADELFVQHKFSDATKTYCSALDIYYKFLAPPFQDLVKIQQRLRTCMLHDGNTEVNYKGPNFISQS